jgi:hypothetical protein
MLLICRLFRSFALKLNLMKKHVSILAVALGMLAPIAVLAGPSDSPVAGKTTKKTAAQAKSTESRTYYYITSYVPTGSGIPVVVRRNGTDTSTLSVVSAYTQKDLERGGENDVASELVKVDPAIMLR